MEQYITNRRIDDLGRVVLPIEVRKFLQLSCSDSVEVWLDKANDQIVLRKTTVTYAPDTTA